MGWCSPTIGKKSIWTNCCSRICFCTTNEFTIWTSIFLDFQYGTDKAPFTSGGSLYGNAGANPFGNTAAGGLYGAGRFGYSINDTSSAPGAGNVATSSADWSDC